MISALEDLPAKPKRIILHWTGGTGKANALDRQHYHYIIEADGTIVPGVDVAANMVQVSSDAPYAAHTRGMNSYSVGVAFAGMAGAVEGGPYGKHPLNRSQVIAGCVFVGELCDAWGLPVTPETVHTHAEAERIHGVKQAGKWDIDVFPWATHLNKKQTGDMLRDWVAEGMRPTFAEPIGRPVGDPMTPIPKPTLAPVRLPVIVPGAPAVWWDGDPQRLSRREVVQFATAEDVHPEVAVEAAPVYARIIAEFRAHLPWIARRLVDRALSELESRIRGI
jgi:hypothetical protein